MLVAVRNLLLFVGFVSFSISWGGVQEAQNLLNKSADKYQKVSGLNIEFESKAENVLTGDVNQYQGELYTQAKTRFKLVTPSIELYSDGESFWDYRPKAQQVLIKNYSDVGMKLGPSQILLEYLECQPKSMKKEKWNGEEVMHIILEPSEKLQQFSQIEVWISSKSLAPKSIRTADYSENIVDYKIKKFKVVKTFAPNFFVWPIQEGVEFIDMR